MIEIIYYINLDSREDRRAHIEKTLKKCDLENMSNRISAVKRDIGVMGCVESHIIALEKFIDSNLNFAMIIEDDLLIKDKDNFKKELSKIFENKLDFDLVQISGNHLKLEECEYDFLRKVIDSQTTSGYIITKDFAPTLLNNFKESLELMNKDGKQHDNCLDIYWKKLQPENKWFAFFPALGIQMPGYSDIENKDVFYNC
jgi:GR25 family glycosyltransferase involved in LPS biosynthesis